MSDRLVSLVVWRDPKVDPPAAHKRVLAEDDEGVTTADGDWVRDLAHELNAWADFPNCARAVSIEDLHRVTGAALGRANDFDLHEGMEYRVEAQKIRDAVARIRAALEGGSDD